MDGNGKKRQIFKEITLLTLKDKMYSYNGSYRPIK